MIITAKLNIPIDTPSERTGRTYPIEEVERAVAEYSEKCTEGAEYGLTVGDRLTPALGDDITKITHKTDNVWMEDGVVMATITLFDTPAGNMIKTLIEADISCNLYPAGVGFMGEEHIVSDYHLVGVDIEMGERNGDS